MKPRLALAVRLWRTISERISYWWSFSKTGTSAFTRQDPNLPHYITTLNLPREYWAYNTNHTKQISLIFACVADDIYTTMKECSSITNRECDPSPKRTCIVACPGTVGVFCHRSTGSVVPPANRNQHFIIIADRCSKLTHAFCPVKTSTMYIETIFHDNWTISYWITIFIHPTRNYSLWEISSIHFVCSFDSRSSPKLPSTLIRNGHAEIYSCTSVAQLRHYVAEHRKDWNIYIQKTLYAFGTQWQGQPYPAIQPHPST